MLAQKEFHTCRKITCAFTCHMHAFAFIFKEIFVKCQLNNTVCCVTYKLNRLSIVNWLVIFPLAVSCYIQLMCLIILWKFIIFRKKIHWWTILETQYFQWNIKTTNLDNLDMLTHSHHQFDILHQKIRHDSQTSLKHKHSLHEIRKVHLRHLLFSRLLHVPSGMTGP